MLDARSADEAVEVALMPFAESTINISDSRLFITLFSTSGIRGLVHTTAGP